MQIKDSVPPEPVIAAAPATIKRARFGTIALWWTATALAIYLLGNGLINAQDIRAAAYGNAVGLAGIWGVGLMGLAYLRRCQRDLAGQDPRPFGPHDASTGLINDVMQAGVLMYVLDLEKEQVVMVSPALARLLNSTEETILGSDLLQFGTEKTIARINEARIRCRATRTDNCNEVFSFVNARGEVLYLQISSKVTHGPNGEFLSINLLNDVTAIEKAHQSDLRARRFADTMMRDTPARTVVLGRNFEIIAATIEFANYVGMEHDKLTGFSIGQILDTKDESAFWKASAEVDLLQSGANALDLIRLDGSVAHVSIRYKRVNGLGGDEPVIFASIDDHTDLVNTRERYETYLREGTSATYFTDPAGKVLYANEAASEVAQWYSRFLNEGTLDHVHPDDREYYVWSQEQIDQLSLREEFRDLRPICFTLPDQDPMYVERTKRCLPGEKPGDRVFSHSIRDVTRSVLAMQKLENLVDYDELTGLLSRRGFYKRIEAISNRDDYYLFLLDIDYFKSVNDNYGHAAGDWALVQMANLLRTLGEECDALCRFGGEEFALLIRATDDSDAIDFAEQIRLAVEAMEIRFVGVEFSRTVSIGLCPMSMNADVGMVMGFADKALHEAKELGRNRTVFAGPEFIEILENRGALITTTDIETAMLNGEFYYALQPIWDTNRLRVKGFEALLRWDRGDQPSFSPAQFHEKFDFICRSPRFAKIRQQMRYEALETLQVAPTAYVAFNVNIRFLAMEGAADAVVADFGEIMDYGRTIVLELSEAALSERSSQSVIIQEITKLRDRGFKIALALMM